MSDLVKCKHLQALVDRARTDVPATVLLQGHKGGTRGHAGGTRGTSDATFTIYWTSSVR